MSSLLTNTLIRVGRVLVQHLSIGVIRLLLDEVTHHEEPLHRLLVEQHLRS